MRHVIDNQGRDWECSDLGLPAYVHPEEPRDETPRVLVTATTPGERCTFLAPLTWETSWNDRDVMTAIEGCIIAHQSSSDGPPQRNRISQ